MRLKNDRLAYEILSAVAEIPCGKVATYGQIARLIGRNKKRPFGWQRAAPCGGLRRLPLPPRGQCVRAFGAGLGGAGGFAARRRCGIERRNPCLPETVSVGLLIHASSQRQPENPKHRFQAAFHL